AVRFAAVEALARGGKEAVSQLVGALKDKRPKVRAGVAQALGLMGPQAKVAQKALAEAAGDKDRAVKEAARKALRRLRPEDAAQLLELIDTLLKIEKDQKEVEEVIRKARERMERELLKKEKKRS